MNLGGWDQSQLELSGSVRVANVLPVSTRLTSYESPMQPRSITSIGLILCRLDYISLTADGHSYSCTDQDSNVDRRSLCQDCFLFLTHLIKVSETSIRVE